LRFGLEVETRAVQAGPVFKRLSFREVFAAVPERILFVIVSIERKVDLGGVNEQRRRA